MPEEPSGRGQKRTNVRLPYAGLLRISFRALQTAAPPLAARLAEILFRTPPRHPANGGEREALASGRRGTIHDGHVTVATWSWGEGPRVLLVHGWGSRGVRLASFAPPLIEAGYSVTTFDAPGHGASPGRLSSLPQFIAALEAVAGEAGPVVAIVAHSMGCSAAAIAMRRGLTVGSAVFLAPAANPGDYSRRFAEYFGIGDAVREAMQRNLERRFGFRWNDFDVPRAASSMTTPLLAFHDREDSDVPWSDGGAVVRAWPGAELVTTRGLGHRRIVHDPEVIARAVAFLRQGERAARASGGG